LYQFYAKSQEKNECEFAFSGNLRKSVYPKGLTEIKNTTCGIAAVHIKYLWLVFLPKFRFSVNIFLRWRGFVDIMLNL
ncbi:MAG: hypothetical protein J7M40_03440, partial [Planctomycetes bacterium]|nr:hypothetical protein [Planctomycetota bacterium]